MDNQTQDGISNTTIVMGVGFTLLILIVAYYLLERNKTPVVVPNTPNNADEPIPGVGGKNGGAKAVGILTDPNFFGGLTNFAQTIADIIEKNKKPKQQPYDVPSAPSNWGMPQRDGVVGPWAP